MVGDILWPTGGSQSTGHGIMGLPVDGYQSCKQQTMTLWMNDNREYSVLDLSMDLFYDVSKKIDKAAEKG